MRVIGERVTTLYADGTTTTKTMELSMKAQRKALKVHVERMKAILAQHEQKGSK